MFDRYDAGEQAVLVHIYFTQDKDMEDLQEFESLVSSAGVEALQVITGSRKAPHPKYFVGEGKAVEIAEAVKATGASVVLFDHALSPAQERNLERLCECRVIDRTGLILDIFAQRARTHEGKLQVELAQLRHLATRLVRGWTHLERQKGGSMKVIALVSERYWQAARMIFVARSVGGSSALSCKAFSATAYVSA